MTPLILNRIPANIINYNLFFPVPNRFTTAGFVFRPRAHRPNVVATGGGGVGGIGSSCERNT